jgi:YggT family protein
VGVIRSILHLVVLAFFVFLLGRLVLDWIQTLARGWRPHGVVLVVAEAVYTVTDPPLRALRRAIPPLRIGAFQIDLAFFLLFFVTFILLGVLG